MDKDENYQLVVGNTDCPLKTIASIIRQSTVIRNEWSTFARYLDVSSDRIKRLRQDLQLDKVTYGDLIFEVLEIWVGKNGSNATLANLLQVVEEHCGANDVGELLRLEFNLPCREADGKPSIEWKDLPLAFQKRVMETFQRFTPNLKHTEILPKLTGPALVRLMRGKPSHVSFSGLGLPAELSYYISRIIVTRNIISDKIFDQNSSDIFLFFGVVDRYTLCVLATEQLTGSSSEQLHGPFNVKFLLRDKEAHFQTLSEKTTHPVHLIRRELGKKLRWIKSKGGMTMATLQNYIDQEQDELEEEEFCQICDSQSAPVIIGGASGIGKSVLLAHVGHKLVQLYPQKSVLFIVFSEFIKFAKPFGMMDKLKMVELTLQIWVGEGVLQFKLNSDDETISTELLLDGYDEVDSEDRKLALEILQTIAKSLKCIRLWITSRSHLMEELENSLNVLGYNIRPFHEENQARFLSSFWSRKVKLDQEKVEVFAKHCLKSLKATMNSTDNDIAGIPLQCLLIGEAFENNALEYAKKGNENVSNTPPEIDIGTITNLYGQMVKNKFRKCTNSAFGNAEWSEKYLMTIHSNLSLEVLFMIEHATLRLAKASEIDKDEMMKGGILISTRMDGVAFAHRTFAEYLVACFIFEKLQEDEEWTPEVMGSFSKFWAAQDLKIKRNLKIRLSAISSIQ